MNSNAKTLKKTLTIQIQEHIKMIIHHDKVGFIRGIQQVIYYHMIISLDAEKAIDKIQYPFMIEVLERSGIQDL